MLNLLQLQQLAPLSLIMGMFIHGNIQNICIAIGVYCIMFFYMHNIAHKIGLFFIIGMMRGYFLENPSPYTNKRTTFSAYIKEIKQTPTSFMLILENFRYEEWRVNYAVDEYAKFPNIASCKIKDITAPIVLHEKNLIARKMRFVGRFLLPTPSCVPEHDKVAMPSAIIDEYEIMEFQNNWLKNILRHKFNALSEQSAQLGKAIILGDSFAIDQEIRASFSKAGVAHLLGVSILNIAIFTLLFYYFLRRVVCRFIYKIAYYVSLDLFSRFFSLIITVLYCLMIGFEYPIVRSLLMSFFSLFALFLGRKRQLEFLIYSCVVIIIINPSAIYDISFQLSFGAVLGLISMSPYVFKNRVINFFATATQSTMAASLAIIPISIYHFHDSSMQPFLSNIICIPYMTFVITPISWLWMACAFFNVEQFVSPLLDYVFLFFIKIAETLAPYGLYVHLDPINFSCVIVWVGCLILFATFQERLRYIFLLFGVLFFAKEYIQMPKRPFLLIHPYASGVVLQNKVICYPKCNFVGRKWAEIYSVPCVDGRNSKFFVKEDCGRLVVFGNIGIISAPLRKMCLLKVEKNVVVSYVSEKTLKIPL